jgi:hypothetical protein
LEPKRKVLVAAGACVLAFIIFLVACSGDNEGVARHELKSIQTALEQLRERVKSLEGI